jgi:hypothetical protein
VLVGGAILSGTGDMVGSMLLVEFPAREDVEVRPFRTAVGAWQPGAD